MASKEGRTNKQGEPSGIIIPKMSGENLQQRLGKVVEDYLVSHGTMTAAVAEQIFGEAHLALEACQVNLANRLTNSKFSAAIEIARGSAPGNVRVVQ